MTAQGDATNIAEPVSSISAMRKRLTSIKIPSSIDPPFAALRDNPQELASPLNASIRYPADYLGHRKQSLKQASLDDVFAAQLFKPFLWNPVNPVDDSRKGAGDSRCGIGIVA